MSYDLYFQKKDGDFSLDEFNTYFKSRNHYTIEGQQATYENKDTGVYFIMEHNQDGLLDEIKNENIHSQVSLSLNYLRPHIFALEAEPEIKSFVKTFNLSIIDPQDNGNPSSVYDKDLFLKGWNAGNKFAFDAISKTNPEIKNLLLNSAEIEKCWKWNFYKEKIQNQLGENVFVPKISFQVIDDELKSFIVWSDAIPTIFPSVDNVVIYRKSLSPSGLFSKKKEDFITKPFSELLPLLNKESIVTDGLEYRTLASENVAKKWVSSFPYSKLKPEPVSIDNVLDKELLDF